MRYQFIASVIAFLIPYVVARQLLAAATVKLSDEEKVLLVNASAKGRGFLWAWILPLVLVLCLMPEYFSLVFALELLVMLLGNAVWTQRSFLGSEFKRTHLRASALMGLSVLLAIAVYVGFEFLYSDACLDPGGRWDYADKVCERK